MENSVIINSIGTATPSVSKILSEAFKMPQEFILKLLYNAPTVLFQKVDEALAKKAEKTLSELGLEVQIVNEKEVIALAKEEVEVSIFFEDVLKLPEVIQQLSDFLGCKPVESLNMLLTSPSIVLGGVSEATAKALEERIDAAVCYSNPKHDLFTIYVPASFSKDALEKIMLKAKRTTYESVDAGILIKDVAYKESSLIWREYQSEKELKVINQTHQLSNVVLLSFEKENKEQLSFLTEKVGIPLHLLPILDKHLPITLYENISTQSAEKISKLCKDIGMDTYLKKKVKSTRRLSIEDIKDKEGVKKVLQQFITLNSLGEGTSWEAPNPIPDLIARYLYAQLEYINCTPKIS
ncbi:hypothetical protein V2590_03540 [Tenacibaculum maritimum]|uniref:hypothetical protein n=1 Tax=Tenacibaculum maritimum TaxID=107401 RepID=UPI003875D44F